ncbi:MAG: tetratricopeptide repeat protein [Candidatus Adiutrix sp.]|nr:tetratricopeptide repeat protein [Candidatus Adiutrix sp.]
MADDKLFPDPQNSESPQSGGSPLDEASGASAYLEAAADSGEINLDGLMPPPASAGEASPPAPEPAPRLRGAKSTPKRPPALKEGPADFSGSSGQAGDFPAEALGGPASAAVPEVKKEDEGSKGRLAATLTGLSSVFTWFCSKIRSIPPIDDIFDRLLFSFGLQRNPNGMLRRANALAHKGRLAEAVKWYRDHLALRPLSVGAYDGLGRVYFRMGLSEEANREFTIADSLERILHNRDDIDAAAALAESFLERKQAKISVSLIEPVLIAHFFTPGNSDLLKAMGRVYAELRANKKMYQVYQEGLAQYPEDYEFHILKGQAEIRLGNVAEGERLVRWGGLMKKLKENPRDANAKMAMGEIYIKEQKIDEGLKRLREAAALLPENTGIRWRLFNLCQKQGNCDEASKYLLEIVALEPDNEDLQYRLADFYRRNKHREEALDIYRDLVDRHPREPRPHALLGDLLVEMGSFDEGQRLKERAQVLEYGLKASPTHQETVAFMKYLFAAGQNEEGRRWLERGLDKWPYHGELVLTKVKILYGEYRYKDAVALLKRLISVKPDVAEPHIWIAICYQRLGDNMAALAEAQLATRLAPKSYTAHKVLGDVLKEQKKLSQANAAYEVAEMMRQARK